MFAPLILLVSYVSFVAMNDFIEYRLGYPSPFLSQAQRTANCYNWFEHYLQKDYDKGSEKDYSEGDFRGNYSLSLKDATLNKYDYIFDKLGLKPGMKLLDAGCGTGVWMDYCRKRGVEVVGLTLSSEQAEVVRKKGLDAHVMDYRVLNESFLGQFDRITALGSSEHVCSSVGALRSDNMTTLNCNKLRIDVLKLFHSYLTPDGKAYFTLLVINDKASFTMWDWVQAYVIERHYGGFYSSLADITEDIVPHTGFKMTDLQDRTRDYYWSSVIDKNHFGMWSVNWSEDTFDKVTYLLKGIAADPYLLHHWAYVWLDTWMWQFGGDNKTPLTEEQVSQAPVQLKYFMLEK